MLVTDALHFSTNDNVIASEISRQTGVSFGKVRMFMAGKLRRTNGDRDVQKIKHALRLRRLRKHIYEAAHRTGGKVVSIT